MFNQTKTQRTRVNSFVDDYLLAWVESFLIDRKAQGINNGTLSFYQTKPKLFLGYCKSLVITQINQITPTHPGAFIARIFQLFSRVFLNSSTSLRTSNLRL